MPEVNTRFEQLLHCDRGHWPPSWIASGWSMPAPELNPLTREMENLANSYQLSAISLFVPAPALVNSLRQEAARKTEA
jgi:hypothetical protein